MKLKQKFKNGLRKAAAIATAVITIAASAVPTGSAGLVTPVNAESDIWTYVDDLNGSPVNRDGQWHKGGAAYGVTNDTWGDIAAKNAGNMRAGGMDCARSAVWIFSHYAAAHGKSLADLGINTGSRMFMGNNVIGMLNGASGMKSVGFDSIAADNIPGTLVVYGTGDYGHMSIYLGDGKVWNYGTPDGGSYQINNLSQTETMSGGTPIGFTAAFEPDITLSKDVSISANVVKTSDNTDVSNGNPNYSLEGAQFRVDVTGPASYSEVITTNNYGNASFSHTFTGIPADKSENDFNITITEVSAPKGFQLNSASQTIKSGGVATFSNTPKNDPVGLTIDKVSADGSDATTVPSLAGAEFTLHFYAVDPNISDDELYKLSPTRTWTMTTRQMPSGKYRANFGSDLKGNGIYKDASGNNILPLGVMTIEETKAPNGYKIADNKFIDVNGNNLSKNANGLVRVNIVNDENPSGARINYGSEYTVSETPIQGGFKIVKYDSQTMSQTPQGAAKNLSATFEIYNNNDYPVVSRDKDGTQVTAANKGDLVYTFKTDNKGEYTSYDHLLSYGDYIIKEVTAPDGYTLRTDDGAVTEAALHIGGNGTQQEDGQVSELIGTFKNRVMRGGVELQKLNADDGSANAEGEATLGPASYEIVSENDNPVIVNGTSYNKGQVVFSFKTNDKGYYISNDDLLPYGTYTLRETEAPTGMNLDADAAQGTQFSIPSDSNIAKVNIKNTSIRGGFTLTKRDSDDSSTTPQGDASLIGGTYQVISNNAKYVLVDKNGDGKMESFNNGDVVYEFTTSKDNVKDNVYSSPARLLPFGEYTLKEVKAPEGYNLSGNTEVSFKISTNNQVEDLTQAIKNDVIRGGFTYQKKNAEDNTPRAEGAATLGPAKYEVVSEAANHVLVNGKWYKKGDVVFTFTTDEKGAYTSPDDLLPYGKYLIRETEAPKGHLLDDAAKKGTEITIGAQKQIAGSELENTPKRGSFTFIKRNYDDKSTNAEGNATLAGGRYQVINDNNQYVLVDKNGDGKYEEFKPGDVVYEFTTTGDTYSAPAKLLPYGTYTLKEVAAPNGYQLLEDNGANLTVQFTVSDDGQVIDSTGENTIKNTLKRGTFSVQKNDLDLGTNRAQGDNNLSAKYALINRSKAAVYVDTNADGKLDLKNEKFEPGEVIRNRANDDSSKKIQYSFTTDADGLFSWPTPVNGEASYWQGLPYGSYEVQEVEAPKNYTTTGNTKITFDINEDGQLVNRQHGHEAGKANEEVFSNKPTYGKIQLYKHVNKQSGSEDDDRYENGAKFLVILTSKVDSLYGGSMQSAWDALNQIDGQNVVDENGNVLLSNHEFSIVTTGTEKNADGKIMNGYGLSGDLVPGNYSIMQFASGSAKDFTAEDVKMKDETKTVDITSNETTTVDGYRKWDSWKDIEDGNRISVTNDEKMYTLRILKKDARTGKMVTYNSASFKLYVDADGDGKLTDADKKYNSVQSNGDIDYTYYKDGEVKIVNGLVTMTSGQKDYDTFRTYSDNVGKVPEGTFVVDELNNEPTDKGTAVQPVTLKKGTYFIVEEDSLGQSHATPAGYTTKFVGEGAGVTEDGTNYLAFTVNGNKYANIASSTAENRKENILTKVYSWFDNATRWVTGKKRLELDDEYYVTETVANDRIFGTLDVDKSIEEQPEGVDYSFIDRKEDIQKIGFTLYATEDVIDPADGSVIVKKGDVAKIYDPKTKDYTIPGVFHPDENGKIHVENIPLGKYILKETSVPDGIVFQGDAAWDVVFEQPADDRTTPEVNVSYQIENYTTKAKFSKTDVTGDNEIPGATLQILDKNGNVVKKNDGSNLEWVSTDKPYFIEGLPTGEYQLKETIAPEGYVLRTSTIPFTIENNGDVQGTKMEDKTYQLTKVDAGGQEVEGAHITVTDKETGEQVDEWTSDKTVHNIKNLTEGHTYVLHEETAPTGYVTATDIEITVNDDFTKNQEVSIVDKRVQVQKVDMCGNDVDGAQISIYELDDAGNIVSFAGNDVKPAEPEAIDETAPVAEAEETAQTEEVSEATALEDTDETKESAAEQPTDAEEDTKESEAEEPRPVFQYTTKAGDTVYADNLKAGTTYLVKETVVPAGYAKMADYKFTVADDGKDQTETLTNKQVSISKETVGGQEVEGAELTITNKDGKPVETWTSTNKPHYVTGLEVGETYTLHENTAPLGYVKATDVTFTVTDDGVDQQVTMVDTIEKFAKYDGDGNLIKGANLELVDDEGNVIDTWTSGEHIVDLDDESKKTLESGTEVTFTTEDGKTIRIVPLSEQKTDADADKATDKTSTITKEQACELKKLNNAEPEKVTDVKDITGYEAIITTTTVDEAGNPVTTTSYKMIDLDGDETEHMVSGMEVGKKYTVKEIQTVDGYYFDDDVTVTNDGVSDGSDSMTDNQIKYAIAKVDDKGNPVVGVTLKLTDVTGLTPVYKNADTASELDAESEGNTDEAKSEDASVTEDEKKDEAETTAEPEATADAETSEKKDDAEAKVAETDDAQKAKVDDKADVTENKAESDKPDDEKQIVTAADLKGNTAEEGQDIKDVEPVKWVDKDGNEVTPEEVELPNGGVTTEEPFELDGVLKADHTYYLEETNFHAGLYKATSFTIAVTHTGTAEVTTIKMIDALAVVSVRKVDQKGNPVKDADMQILDVETDDNGNVVRDENGNAIVKTDKDGKPVVVYEFKSTDDEKGTDISNYVKGNGTYILRETEAPFGYKQATDQEFKVTGVSDSAQVIVMVDQPQQIKVVVNKVSEEGKKPLAGAEITAFVKATEKGAKDLVVTHKGKAYTETTDNAGQAKFRFTYDPKASFYVMETKAPAGYILNTQKFDVKLDKEYDFTTPISITIVDKGTPTGVSMPARAIGTGVAAAAALAVVLKKRKKHDDSEAE